MPTISARKNVLIICTDEQRYDSLGCNGNPFAVTPHIDALAKDSTNFRRHIAANPICMPSRASFITGRYANAHGVHNNGVALPRRDPRYEATVGGDIPTLADVLGGAGYHTRSIGKLHFTPYKSDAAFGFRESRDLWSKDPSLADWHGPYYGFEHVTLTLAHGEEALGHYGRWLRKEHPEAFAALASPSPHRFIESIRDGRLPAEAHQTTWAGNESCAFLQTRRPDDRQPFFLYVSFSDPHHPFTPPAELAREFERHDVLPWHVGGGRASRPRAYAQRSWLRPDGLCDDAIRLARQYTDAMNHLIDRNVGRILDTLKHQGLFDETIIIFTSDHGDFLGDFGLMFKDLVACNALNHVPFLLRAPGAGLPAECGQPMSNADVLPTLCELLDISPPPGVQGLAATGAIRAGSTDNLAPVFAYHANPLYRNFTVYDARHRFTIYPGTGERELFDHHDDPHELNNRAGDPALAGVERELLTALMELHLKSDCPVGNRVSEW